MTDPGNTLTACLKKPGNTPNCSTCPLQEKEYCKETMRLIPNMVNHLKRHYWHLAESDHTQIIKSTFDGILFGVKHHEEKKKEILNIAGYAWRTYENQRKDYFRKLPRFGELSRLHIPTAPPGLNNVVKAHPDFLSIEESILSAKPELSREIKKKLLALTEDEKWAADIERLYKNTWKAQLVSIEDICRNNPEPEDNRNKNPEELLNDKYEKSYLEKMIDLFENIGSDSARRCANLFRRHGEDIFDDETSRSAISAELDLAPNTLNQRVSRCLSQIHEKIITILKELGTDQAGYCEKLFIRLHGKREKGTPTGMIQIIREAAAEFRVTEKEIYRLMRFCRELALNRIG